MALYFHKLSLKRATSTLISQIDTFRVFVNEPQYPLDYAECIDYCIKNASAIENAISIISTTRSDILQVIENVKEEYSETKKSERKEFLDEFQIIETETSYNERINEADAILTALKTRLGEIKCEHAKNLSRYTLKKGGSNTVSSAAAPEKRERQRPSDLAQATTEGTTNQIREKISMGTNDDNHPTQEKELECNSIRLPQVSIPHFHGDISNFQEYWAIYCSLVHNNSALSTMEKIILLKESLVGKAANTIKGIQMIPENYQWMINTILKKYDNITSARANVIKRIASLPAARDNAKVCESVFDDIRALVNEMTSSGYAIADTCDPMWVETILKKFPRQIVEEYLRENKTGETYTVGETLDKLEEIIIRHAYISERLGNHQQQNHPSNREESLRTPTCNFCERTNHKSHECRTVKDNRARRKICMEKSLCWKCFTTEHSSNECRRPNCKRCNGLHDVSLCVAKQGDNSWQQIKTPNKSHVGPTQKVLHNQLHDGTRQTVQNPSFVPSLPVNGAKGEECNQQSLAATLPSIAHDHRKRTTVRRKSKVVPSSYNMSADDQIVLMTAEGLVWNHSYGRYDRALFFFDTGAHVSLILEHSADYLALPVLETEQCSLSGIGGTWETFMSHHVVLQVQTAQGRELKFPMKTKPMLTTGFPAVHLTECDIRFMEDHNVFLTNTRMRGELQIPHILIGIDLYSSFVNESFPPIQLPSGLRVARTLFGFVAYGRGRVEGRVNNAMPTLCNTVISESEMLRNIFELEGLGISSKEAADDENTYAYLTNYAKLLRYDGKCISAPFPLKANVANLNDNYNMAFRRLISQLKHLEQFPERKKWYAKIINQYLKEDVIEEVYETVPDSAGTYYMPHAGVWKEHKSTPLRIVFDASSKQKGQLSLNDVIHTGASFVNRIHDILVASREKPIILVADIQAAFTQIRIHESHRDLCRFLWTRDLNKPPLRTNLVEYRWKRVPFGITSSPSMLNMVLSAYLRDCGTPLSNEILSLLYVDNVLISADSKEEAIAKYKESKALFSKIGMNLRAFVSNSPDVNFEIDEKDRAPCEPMKILGVNYNPVSDTYFLETDFSSEPKVKRDFLRQHHSIYDPIGLAAPLMISQKHLLRRIFEEKIDWNEDVSPEITLQWQKITKAINNFYVQIPRQFFATTNAYIKPYLWVFADASNTAMAVCGFFENSISTEVSRLVSGKTKLAPQKRKLTTPKLELLAILLAFRLAESIASVIRYDLSTINIVSDSLIALSWIRSQRKIPLFASNQRDRIKTIANRLTAFGCKCHIFHVPGEKNPADAGTRGVTSSQLGNLDWVNGPQWLLNRKERASLVNIESIEPGKLEDFLDEEEAVVVLTGLVQDVKNESPIVSPIIDLSRYNSFNKALRVTSYVAKFIAILKEKTSVSRQSMQSNRTESKFGTSVNITPSDLKEAENLLFHLEHEKINLSDLQKRHREKQLFRDEQGIIRCASRLQNANLQYDTRNPIYVGPQTTLMRLILLDLHRNNAHCGKNHLLTLARQRFWLSKPSRCIRSILKNCVACQKAQSLPFEAPQMASLPPDRVIQAKPFQNIGCDFIGPLALHNNVKVYICIFTCLTTRALHLEVVENLSAGAFLSSFVRFVSRRGVPTVIRTDCGTNFVLGQKVLDTLFTTEPDNDNPLISYCTTHRITWLFNPPGAPWMGGVWERLVGSVKLAFQKSVGKKKLSLSDMMTVTARIEAILNTRPLTAVSTTDASVYPLRPIDFLQGNVSFSLPPLNSADVSDDDASYDPDCIQTVSQAKEALEHSERIATKFWNIWNIEYLTVLRDTQKSLFKARKHNARASPEVGEIVLIEQELIPRGHWAIGIIAELVMSADGLVRSAKIRLPHKRAYIQRPITKLYPLEIRATVPAKTHEQAQDAKYKQSEGEETLPAQLSTQRHHLRPQRAAKTKACEAIRQQQKQMKDNASTAVAEVALSVRQPVNIGSIFAILMLMTLQGANCNGTEFITCTQGIVTVHPTSRPFEVCFSHNCKTYNESYEALQYVLEPSPNPSEWLVTLRSGKLVWQKSCMPQSYCDGVAKIFSKALIGNPHCWPTGAILSVALLCYFAISVILLIIWLVFGKKETTGTVVTNNTNIVLTNTAPVRENRPFSLRHFTPAGMNTTETVFLVTAVFMFAVGSTCQDGYMRHSVDITCSERNECYYEYRREVLFNSVQTSLCVQLRHQNVSVGNIKIERVTEHLACRKVSYFWTRETRYQVDRVTRCRGMGSCNHDRCETLKPSEMIPELNATAQFPGYTSCSTQCSGVDCICLIPWYIPRRVCTFFRISHVPTSPQVYEIFECAAWTPKITLKISVEMYNTKENGTISLIPYHTKEFAHFNFTVISLQMPSFGLHQKYAQTDNETFIVPSDHIFPVTCQSLDQAVSNFSTCTTAHYCDCDAAGLTPSCHCPYSTFAQLRLNREHILPISTPYITISSASRKVFAEYNKGETTVAIVSNKTIETARLNVNSICAISAKNLSGCYNCELGSMVEISCQAETESWATVECAQNIFSIKCSPKGITTKVKLTFENAIVNTYCHTVCGGRNVTTKLSGVLHYISYRGESDIFLRTAESHIPQFDWLKELHFPDMSPMWMVLVDHWKVTLIATIALALMIALTYVYGPVVILTLVKFLAATAVQAVKLIAVIAKFVASLLLATVRWVTEKRQQ